MARGKKTGGRDFVPGVGGPGRPPMSPEMRAAKALTRTRAIELLSRYLACRDTEIAAVMADPATPQLDKMIIAVIESGKSGDTSALGFILDRTIGKVVETMRIEARPSLVIHRPDGSRIEMTQLEAGDGASEVLDVKPE